MAMENYSPSHPTDEVDLDHSPPVVNADLKESKEKPISSTKSDRKSHSKSPERKSTYKARSRSRSRKRRSRSRSKNRRSRSRNRSDKSYNKSRDYDSRSIDRRSHSKDRRSRSKDRKPRSNEKRSRSKDRRSKSRESKRYHNRDSRSPYRQRDSRSNSQRKSENNIFSKMSELSGSKVREEPVKSKWTYDSDEETKPTVTSATSNDSGFTDPANRFDDAKSFHRKPDYNDSSFSDRNDDQKPYHRRQEFSNNRRGGGDFSRGNFNRNRNWEPRNNRSNNFRNFNNRNNFSAGSGGFSNDNWKQPEPPQKAPWTEEDDETDTKAVFNDTREVIMASVSPNTEESSSKPFESSPVAKPDLSGFVVDSDEDICDFNKSDRNESKRNQSDNNRNFGDNNRSFNDNNRDSGGFQRNRDDNNFDLGDSSAELGRPRSLNEMLTIANLESKNVSDNQMTEHCPSSTDSPCPAVTAPPVGTAADSDEEDFGAWNKELKTTKQTVVSTEDSNEPRANKWGQERDNDEEDFGSWGASNRDHDQSASGSFEQNPQQFYPQGNNYQQPRSNFYGRNNDNNQRYPMNNYQNNNRRGGGNFNRFQRPGMSMNSNNNMNNNGNGNQYHPHQQQHHQQQPDRFGANNYGSGNRGNNPEMMNMKMPPPPTMFNPSQRPPNWSMGNTVSGPGFPGGMCNGPMATGPMQFPMGNSGSGSAAMAPGMMGGSNSMMAPPPQMQFPPQLGHPMGGHGHGGPIAPAMSLPNLMQSMQQQHSYIPPPPPATQPMHSMQLQTQQHGIHGYGQQQHAVPSDSNNLLEAIMTNVGLSSKSMELYKSSSSSSNSSSMMPGATAAPGNISGQSASTGNGNRQQQSTVSDSLSSIIKSAASTVLSRLALESASAQRNNTAASSAMATATSAATGNISDSMSMSPPSPACSPPPPIRHQHHSVSTGSNNNGSGSEPLFVLPPLPNYNDIIKPASLLMSTTHKSFSSGTTGIPATAASSIPPSVSSYSNAMAAAAMPGHLHQQQSSSVSEISEEKRNRSDFDSKSDWQERIALEVKNFLRPAYMGKKINKADYKEIMKRCVTKISRSGVTEINTEKIEKFVLSYVDKYQKFRRGKQHGVVSSSEHELVM